MTTLRSNLSLARVLLVTSKCSRQKIHSLVTRVIETN